MTKRENKLGWLTTAGLACCLALALAACGGSPEPTPTPTTAPTPTATLAPPPPTAAPLEQFPTAQPGDQTLTPAAGATLSSSVPSTATTVSEPSVVEEGDCAVEYDLDLAGYPDLLAKMGCALEKANNDAVAINEFGEGPDYNRFMLWFSNELQIYVLFPDQTWQAYLDTWSEGQPELSCNPLNVPPTSPPLPRRGFGKLWCSVDGLIDKMGTIDREERLCQHTVVQRFEKGRLLACFEDATIRYFRLLDDGAWDMVMIR
jgi:hypothetical protein